MDWFSGVGAAVRLPIWGSWDPSKRWLETIGGMVQYRNQLRSCIRSVYFSVYFFNLPFCGRVSISPLFFFFLCTTLWDANSNRGTLARVNGCPNSTEPVCELVHHTFSPPHRRILTRVRFRLARTRGTRFPNVPFWCPLFCCSSPVSPSISYLFISFILGSICLHCLKTAVFAVDRVFSLNFVNGFIAC